MITLYKHQQEALDFALEIYKTGPGVALLMEMRTGKTGVAIRSAQQLYLEKRIDNVIVVCPKTILGVWSKEIPLFCEVPYEVVWPEKIKRTGVVKKTIINKKTGKKEVSKTPVTKTVRQVEVESSKLSFVLINYDTIYKPDTKNMWVDSVDLQRTMIIADESTKIKNTNAKTSKAMHLMGSRCRYKMILTGTPIGNHEIDFFSQYKFLDSSVFGTKVGVFRENYFNFDSWGQPTTCRYPEELKEKIHSIAFRKRLRDVIDMPNAVDTIIPIELESSAKKHYNEVLNNSLTILKSLKIVTARTALVQILRLLQATGGFIGTTSDTVEQISTAKLQALEQIFNECKESGKKVVVFCRFIPELLAIEKLANKYTKPAIIYGAIEDDNRVAAWTRFQEDPDCTIFVGQLQTVGMGIPLYAADIAVFYSLSYSYLDYEQARARILYMDKADRPCHYIHLIASNTYDEKVLDVLKSKKDCADMIVDNIESLIVAEDADE